MLTYMDKTCIIKANLEISKCGKVNPNITLRECDFFHKINMHLNSNLS